jgi:hypothetical protein
VNTETRVHQAGSPIHLLADELSRSRTSLQTLLNHGSEQLELGFDKSTLLLTPNSQDLQLSHSTHTHRPYGSQSACNIS